MTLGAFLIFAVWSVFPSHPNHAIAVTDAEYSQLRLFTIFFIGAILPSDALIRFGRNLLFKAVEDADSAATDAPASTIAQNLAFVTFLVVAVVELFSGRWISHTETPQVLEVARTLTIALLPSDAAVRFGRAIYLRGTPAPTADQMHRV